MNNYPTKVYLNGEILDAKTAKISVFDRGFLFGDGIYEVMVQITDVTGKVIEVMNEGVRTAGSHVLNINSNKLAAGTYYYTISTSNGKVTKAMNVTK